MPTPRELRRFYTNALERYSTPGQSLLLLIAAFWYLRAVEQVFFSGLRKPLSVAFFVVFLVGGSLYAMALL